MAHYTRGQRSNGQGDRVARGLSASPQAVQEAALVAEQALIDAGVRHLYCGGIAVAAYGYERATKDVDFLVGDEAFNKRGRLVFPRPDVPVSVGDVLVDLVTLPDVQAQVEAELNGQSRIVSLPFLLLMKLLAFRPKDRRDVVELLKVDASRADELRDTFGLTPDLRRKLALCEREAEEEP